MLSFKFTVTDRSVRADIVLLEPEVFFGARSQCLKQLNELR